MKPKQVRERLQVGEDTAYQLIASGAIRSARISERCVRISEAALAEYLASVESGGWP